MENMTIPMTSRTDSALTSSVEVTSFGTPARGCAFGTARIAPVNHEVTDLAITQAILRDRTAVATKGHMAFVAYVSGSPAWSPPIC